MSPFTRLSGKIPHIQYLLYFIVFLDEELNENGFGYKFCDLDGVKIKVEGQIWLKSYKNRNKTSINRSTVIIFVIKVFSISMIKVFILENIGSYLISPYNLFKLS